MNSRTMFLLRGVCFSNSLLVTYMLLANLGDLLFTMSALVSLLVRGSEVVLKLVVTVGVMIKWPLVLSLPLLFPLLIPLLVGDKSLGFGSIAFLAS